MGLAVWRDISLMWLVLLSVLMIVPIAVVFVYANLGVHRLLQLGKLYLPIAQAKTQLVAIRTGEIGQKVVSPIIAVQARSAQTTSIIRAIVRANNK
jgi:hypothetical protein